MTVFFINVNLVFALALNGEIPDLSERNFGPLCYCFKGVAPHPNYPQVCVLFLQSKMFASLVIVFHCRLTNLLALTSSNVSYLFYKKKRKQQIQAVVKLYGVFAFIWKNLDYAPNKLVSPYSRRGQYDPRWTFMQAAN